MALKIWMPFISDTENQGLCASATLQKTAGTYTANASGKLGGCYSGSGLYHASAEFLGNQWSVAVWVSANSFGQYNNIIFCKNLAASTDCQIYWSIISNNTYNIGVNGPSGTTTYSYTFSTNTWYHLATTYDGARIKMYINGALVKDVAYASTQPSGRLNFGLGARSGNEAGTSLQAAGDWKYNDFRLYDTVISDKDVEELARGLVLHYKLSDPSVEGTTNLCSTSASGWNNSGTCVRTANDTSILFPPTKSNTYSIRATSDGSMAAQIGLTPASHPSKTIVASTWVWLDGTQDSSSFYLRSVKTDGSVGYLMYKGQSNPTLWPQRQWIRIATDPIATAADATTFYICTYVNKNTEVRAFNGWQIEAKDHPTAWTPPGTTRAAETRMCDCSGYKHHGSIVNTLATSFSTPRYTASIKIPAASSGVKLSNFSIGNVWSMGCWFYYPSKDNTGWKALVILNNNGGDADLQFGNFINCSATNLQYSANGRYTTSVSFTYGTWNHVFNTYDGTVLRCYLNGQYQASVTPGQTLLRSNLGIGFKSSATDFSAYGNSATNAQISDVRIYATALSDKQVLELYNESAAIDRAGTFFTRELIEQ